MARWWPLVLLLIVGCDRREADHWKDLFVKEVNFHYQTQQTKNAEIAAREIEIENNKVFIGILGDRIKDLEKEVERMKGLLAASRPPGVRKPVRAKITAVASEIHIAVISSGGEEGIMPGDEFQILRGTERIARLVIDRVDAKWSAGKVSKIKEEPRIADDVTNEPASREK